MCFFEDFNSSHYIFEVFFILIHNKRDIYFLNILLDLKAVPETKELPPKKDFCEEKLSKALLMERLTDCSLQCSVFGENWDYGALFERQPVSQEITLSQNTIAFIKKAFLIRKETMTAVSMGDVSIWIQCFS